MIASSTNKNDKMYPEKVNLYLPNNWWSSSYSYNFYAKEENTAKVIPLSANRYKNINKKRENDFPKTLGYDLSNGDYHIQETFSSQNDFSRNQKVKKQIIKYSVYPVIIFALILTFSILNGIAELPF